MSDDVEKELSKKYCPRFGMIAVEMGFVSSDYVKKALSEQLDDNFASKPHRLIGRIMLDNGWMNPRQIELVMNQLFKNERFEQETS